LPDLLADACLLAGCFFDEVFLRRERDFTAMLPFIPRGPQHGTAGLAESLRVSICPRPCSWEL